MLGLDNTSPTFASAIQNSVPAITFLMAALLRQVHTLSLSLSKKLETFTHARAHACLILYNDKKKTREIFYTYKTSLFA